MSEEYHLTWTDRPTMAITTVIGCANACCYCPQQVLAQQYNKMDNAPRHVLRFEDFKTCLERIPRDVLINFSGMAEPWLNPDCTEMLLYAHERGFGLLVYTTAVGMDLAEIPAIEQVPFKRFVVHLPDAERRSRIPTDDAHIAKLRRLEESRIKRLELRAIGRTYPKIKAGLRKQVREFGLLSRAGNLANYRAIGIPPRKDHFDPSKKMRGKIRCSRMTGGRLNRNVLLPNGDVLLCCMDYGMKHTIGNLLTDTYADLFRSPAYLKVTEGLAHGADILCRSCEEAVQDVPQ